MSGFTYDKNSKRWLKADGNQVRLGNRILTSNGDYIQLNSDGTTTKIGSKGKGITQDYANYAKAHKINTDLDNQAMINGLIKDNNRWRPNTGDKKTRIINKNGRSYFLDSDGSWRNTQNGIEYNQDIKSLSKSSNSALPKGPESYAGKAAQWLSGVFGHKLGNKTSELTGTALYMIPFLGEGLSAMDAYNNFKKGNIKEGIINTLFAIPGLGKIGRGARALSVSGKAFKAAGAINKGLKVIKPIEQIGHGALNGYMMYSMPKMGVDLYKGYNSIKQLKNDSKDAIDIYNQLKRQGQSNQQIKQFLGMDDQQFNMLKTISENNTWGILGKYLTDDNLV